MAIESPNLSRQAVCRRLRSKEMFFDTGCPPDEHSGSGLFWCARTQQCLGPDGQPADQEDCRADRGCYEP